jgi:hypothetical protein
MKGGKPLSLTDTGLVREAEAKIKAEIDPYFSFHDAGRPLDEVRSTALGTRYHVIFVDHLGLIGRGQGDKFKNLDAAVEFLRALSLGKVVKDYRPFVCALQQLNREIEKADTVRVPRLADLWGSTEADADTVLMMYGSQDLPGGHKMVKGVVRKNRQGPEPAMFEYHVDPFRYDVTEMGKGQIVQPAQHPASFPQPDEGAEA